MKRSNRFKNKFVGAWSVMKQVSFASFNFTTADDRNLEIFLWLLHSVGGNKHNLKFRFVK
ncbi:hypothetical protein [Prevotella intermedia]|uniref:hypothetical protein n=1 Tax=Prevotella intermedia TaxID=28131 RepID=UPI000F530242|nr:hypothetical protein [Prevotella intermedia]